VTLTVLIPVGAFIALVVLFALVLRRTGRVIADTRDAEGFRRATRDLGTRIDISLGGIAARIDAVRRHRVPPSEIDDDLVAALEAVGRYLVEVADLGGPSSAASLRDDLRADLGRAERALEMVRHGCAIMATSRGIGRDTEAETSLKRGYLNLLHARDAIAAHAAGVGATQTEGEPAWFGRRRDA
jgi:hypothetical protein